MSKLLKRSFRRNCAFACQSKHGRQFYTICLHVEFSNAILPCDFNWSFQNYDSPQFYLNCKGINTFAFVEILIYLWPESKNRLINRKMKPPMSTKHNFQNEKCDLFGLLQKKKDLHSTMITAFSPWSLRLKSTQKNDSHLKAPIHDNLSVKGTFDHGFFGHPLKMPPAGLGDGQRQVRLS